MDMGNRGEGVDHHGASRRAFDDDGKSVPQVRLPQQFDLGPQMGDQHTGNPQEARLLTGGFGLEARRPPMVANMCSLLNGRLSQPVRPRDRRKMEPLATVLCCAL